MTVALTNNQDISLSVIIPCYNQGEYLLEAISSVQRCQSHDLYELIIVNDGSTDPITQKVLNYLKDRSYLIIDQPNQGLSGARNTGIKSAKGRYILPLDADNKIRETYIYKSIEILDEYPEIGVVYGNAEFFGDKTGLWEIPEFDVNRLVMGNYIDACAVFRKAVWEDCGGYDSQIPNKLGYEDWDFWLGAAEKGWKFHHIPEVLFEYRFRNDSMVSGCNIPENRKQLFRYICAKHIGLYATNFANIFAEKEFVILRQMAHTQSLQMRLKQAETEKETFKIQQETAHIQLQADFTQNQTKLTQTQQELELCHTELSTTQTQLEQTQQALEHAQNQLSATQLQREQTQQALEQQLSATQAQLEQLQQEMAEAHRQLTGTKVELEQAQTLIQAMETSKFWKLRAQWFKLKKALKLGHNA
jgi:glycosyltransferase involved in cell wall biosynthesis